MVEYLESTTSPLLFLVSVLHHVIFLEKNHYHVPYRPGVSLEGSVDRELKTSDNLDRLQPINSPSPTTERIEGQISNSLKKYYTMQ